ncbi:MAG: hypothetical protein ACE5GW_06390 [Planctomycetota bacterium]
MIRTRRSRSRRAPGEAPGGRGRARAPAERQPPGGKGRARLEGALGALERARGPLFRELREVAREEPAEGAEPRHVCCTRRFNQMRISSLEAIAIARALERDPGLRRRREEIERRILAARRRLKDSERRQNYDCPLLEGNRCLVHGVAKPIACLAWNPGREISEAGWRALERRDRLNDSAVGRGWELKAIPVMLARHLGVRETPRAPRPRQHSHRHPRSRARGPRRKR